MNMNKKENLSALEISQIFPIGQKVLVSCLEELHDLNSMAYFRNFSEFDLTTVYEICRIYDDRTIAMVGITSHPNMRFLPKRFKRLEECLNIQL